MHLSRVWSSQILCLVSGGMCGWNIIVLQSRVCLYVRYWCHLHTGGKFDCPCCLELFRLPCLNTTPTKSGTCTWPCSICVYGPFTTQLPKRRKNTPAALCKLTVYCLISFYLCLSTTESMCWEKIWLFPFLTVHFPVKITFQWLVKLWEPFVYLLFVAFSFQCEWDRQTLTCWRLVMIRHVIKEKVIALMQTDY